MGRRRMIPALAPAPLRGAGLGATLALALVLTLGGVGGMPAMAQGLDPLPFNGASNAPVTPILTIDSERFFAESAFGRRLAEEIEAAGVELAAENRRIEADLTEEEQSLTDRRASLPADQFRVLADDFDVKVQRIRREQDAKARALTERTDADRVAFLSAARPVLGQIMYDAGASVILERGSVFFSSNASDITDLAIQHIDAAIGDGLSAPEAAPGGTAEDGSAGPAPDAMTGQTPETTPDAAPEDGSETPPQGDATPGTAPQEP